MFYFVWLGLFPVVLFAIGIALCIILAENSATGPRQLRTGYDPRPLLQRWEDPYYAGSMGLADELRHVAAICGSIPMAQAAEAAEQARWERLTPLAPAPEDKAAVLAAGVPHTGEWDTMFVPAWTGELEARPAAAVTICPVCEAHDDQPHSNLCQFYEPFTS